MPKPKIAIFSGPTATIQNSEPLVTSNKARAAYGLPPKTAPDGTPLRWDPLRPQRLAAPVTVYVEQFSAHPLEKDTAELYAAPDGYVDAAGCFHTEPTSPSDKAVYKIELLPEDGVYPLPYYGRQADGSAWEEECAFPGASYAKARQGFYPDASRIVEEIDRLGLGASGWPNLLSSLGDFDFYRAAPSGGYTKGLPSAERTDVGEGDIAPELPGDDYFFYKPAHLRREPPRGRLAKLTNIV
ncbi:MAG: hypothetical protein NTZ05_15350, partial [Chloroflexi bacterium]|nr:hypothetical protein [Chloroflexota bacterium]